MGAYNLEKAGSKKNRSDVQNGDAIELQGYDTGQEKKSKSKEKSGSHEPVGFFELFRYSDGLDKVMMVIGTICAIAHGLGTQLNFVILADVLDQFIDLETSGDNETSTEDAISDLVPDIVLQFCLNATGVLISGYVHMMCWTLTAERQIRVIRQKAFRSVLKQHMGWFDQQQSGELNIRLTSDIINMHSGMGDKVTTFIQWLFTFLTGCIICFVRGWELTLVMVAVSPLIVGVGGGVARSLKLFATKEVQTYAAAGGVASEVLGSIRIVNAYNGHEKEAKRYEGHLTEARKVGIKRGFANGLGQGILWVLVFGVIALAFWYGNQLIRDRGYKGGTIMQVQFALFTGMRALGQAISNLENFALARSSAATVYELIESESEIDSSSTEGKRLDNLQGNFKLSNVNFFYPSRKDYQALSDFTLELSKGKTVAIVGPSGSGKSTVVQLLQRFYDPSGGQVTLDGVNLKDLNVRWLREQIGVVMQEPALFATSIGENISFGKVGGATQAEIEEAAKKANAHDFITKLPQKYDTPVGARGGQLSGGQKQRVAVARALVQNPRILILDDATSALDYVSESIVQAALDKDRHNRTTLIIAHRLSTIRNADIICCIDQGVIQEMGSHEELVQQGGLYSKLATKMAESNDDEDDDDEDESGDDLDTGDDELDVDDIVRAHSNSISSSPVDAHIFADGRRMTNGLDRQASSQVSLRRRASSRMSNRKKSAKKDKKGKKGKKDKKTKESSEEEEEEVTNAPASRMFKLNSTEWPYMLVGAIGAIVQGAIWPAIAMFASEILAAYTITDPEEQEETINEYVLVIVGIGVGAGIATFCMIAFFNASGEYLTERLRSMSFRAMIRQEVGWFDERRNQVGSLTSRLATDASMVKQATGTALSTLVNAVTTIVLSLLVAFLFGPILALVVSVFIPPLVATGMVQTKLLVGFARGSKESVEEGGKIVSEAIDNIKTVASLTQENTFIDQFDGHFEKSFKEGKKRSQVFGVTWGLSQSIIFFGYAANYGFGSYLVSQGDMEFQNVFRVFVAISSGALELGRINAFASDYSKAKVSAGKLFALFDRKSLINSTSTTGPKPGSCTGNVTFKDVHFRYPTRKAMKILNGLTVSVPKGQTLALVGPSGCGKSTTIGLMERFYDPEAGNVLLDGTDVRDVNVQWLRNQISLVAQEPILFDSTIRDNIAYGDQTRQVPIEEVIECARMANIHEFITQLPQGYETVVGPSGIQLVGGQKQRITIARAMVKNPKILLLDEATSALDTENEKVVQEALDKASEGRTCIVIAHRLSTIENAHIICVIEAGEVVEIGTHHELMKKGGLYYQLQLIQAGGKDS